NFVIHDPTLPGEIVDYSEGILLVRDVLGRTGIDEQVEDAAQALWHCVTIEIKTECISIDVDCGVIESEMKPKRPRRWRLRREVLGANRPQGQIRAAVEQTEGLLQFGRTDQVVSKLLSTDFDDAPSARRDQTATLEFHEIEQECAAEPHGFNVPLVARRPKPIVETAGLSDRVIVSPSAVRRVPDDR